MITFPGLGTQGRLGNQLFQIAATISLALSNNDTYGFPYWDLEPYFNLHGCFYDKLIFKKTYIEKEFAYNKIPYEPDLSIEGYYQSIKYFEPHQDLIRKLLTPKCSVESIPNVASLHVRRGDYLQLKDCFHVLDMDYYQRAISQLPPVKKIMVFSDDMEWCKQNFTGDKFIFMENNLNYVDLGYMSKCTHNIIANSSFSFWGAWLNKNPNKTVIVSKNWFGSKLSPTHNIKNLIPEQWIKV